MFFIKNLLVFFGGKSPERDVSVITGLLTLNSIDKTLYNPIGVYVDGEGKFWVGEGLEKISFYKNLDFSNLYRVTFCPGENKLLLTKKRKKKQIEVYCAINCMHGRNGEDGVLIGLLRLCNIAFVSPDLFSCSLAIDKDFTKIVASGLKINVTSYVRIKRSDFFSKSAVFLKYAEQKLGYPIIVKPARLGSSIGIKKANNKTELFSALCEGFNYDDKIVCESYLANSRDLNCAVYKLGSKLFVSQIEEAIKSDEILSFNDKYGGSEKAVGSKRKRPLDLSQKTIAQIKDWSKTLYQKLDFSSIVRFDFLLQGEKVYLNEINAVPGSLAYYLFCEKISQFTNLLTSLIEDAKESKRKEDNYNVFYKSQILNGNFENAKK